MSERWRGIFKLGEEMGELHQVLGKLSAYPTGEHPGDGTDLRARAVEEIADVRAALAYFVDNSALDRAAIEERYREKLLKFRAWSLPGVRTDD